VESPIEVRAHRGLFRPGWRITTIPWLGWDVTKLVAGGLAVWPVVFFIVAAAAMAALSWLLPLSAVPYFGTRAFRYFGIPLAVALLSRNPPPDERPTHVYMLAQIGRAVRLPRRSGWTKVRGELAVRWDASSSTLKPGRVTGVAWVRFNVLVDMQGRPGRLVARGLSHETDVSPADVVLCDRTRLEIRP
jgi:hypothetical protein